MTSEPRTCTSCGEPGGPDAQWCEACGAALDGASSPGAADTVDGLGLGPLIGPPCVDCGADHEHIVDGYCGQCGRKQPGARDHLVEALESIVAATDRGKRHHQNEDAFAIGVVDDRLIAVVCDGVSTTDNPQDASLAAAEAARDHLVAALSAGSTDFEAMLASCVDDAQAAARAIPTIDGGHGPASTTFVATIVVPDVDGGLVRTFTAWLGDSRAYWVSTSEDDGLLVTQLTTDDSWGLVQVASGVMTHDEAMADPRAQSITRWLGADAVHPTPTIQQFEHDPGGSLLVCSDGLWKYVPTEGELASLLETMSNGESLVEHVEALVRFANESGGHDNTTVVIASP